MVPLTAARSPFSTWLKLFRESAGKTASYVTWRVNPCHRPAWGWRPRCRKICGRLSCFCGIEDRWAALPPQGGDRAGDLDGGPHGVFLEPFVGLLAGDLQGHVVQGVVRRARQRLADLLDALEVVLLAGCGDCLALSPAAPGAAAASRISNAWNMMRGVLSLAVLYLSPDEMYNPTPTLSGHRPKGGREREARFSRRRPRCAARRRGSSPAG